MDGVNVHDVDIDTSKVKIFLEECMTELKSGNRPNTYLNKSACQNICKRLLERNEFKYYDRLTRLETGISTDPVRNIISASKEWWDEKIKEDKEYAKFKDKNLDVYQTYYEALFGIPQLLETRLRYLANLATVALRFVDITDGKEDTDEVRLFDDVDSFLTYDSSSKKRRGKKLTPRRDNKKNFEGKNEGKSMANSSYEEKLDTVFDVLLTRSTQPSRRGNKLTPIRYHILDFRRGQTHALREPKGFKEKFNYYHSSLRNVIERTFGVWKARWVLLRDMHVNFDFETQVKIVLASMAIHSYIRMSGSGDATFQIAQEESYNPRNDEGYDDGIEPHDEVSSGQHRNDDMYMNAVRDMITGQIFSMSNTRACNDTSKLLSLKYNTFII
uniref:DDE Tnp4 domain-containing protein n=1 Tax=Lactuca sativa TaxID=4236 RepID=A0A9R1W5N3_LACSA|nr:hypothetical protein LSAT_V11C300149300 [Lactuca sativa]